MASLPARRHHRDGYLVEARAGMLRRLGEARRVRLRDLEYASHAERLVRVDGAAVRVFSITVSVVDLPGPICLDVWLAIDKSWAV
jgi:hypothetical protein